MKSTVRDVPFYDVTLTDGFWKDRYLLNKDVSIESVYRQFEKTGRMDALRFNWKEGKDLHFFYDSDAAKWIESVAYCIRAGYALPHYQKVIDALVDSMEKHRLPNGYINSYFQQVEPNAIFTDRSKHELYCAGHLIEAAIAYDQATHKRKLLDLMIDYAHLIHKVFVVERSAEFYTSGHPEIELAMYRLYRHTGDAAFLETCKYFITERHKNVEYDDSFANAKYDQCEKSVYELDSAEGHAVRALYLYRGMAQYARETDDAAMRKVLETLFDDMDTKTYITGALGSSERGESFTVPYDLPNQSAYAESCAAIAMVLLCDEMEKFGLQARYADSIERILYNAGLSPTSLDGKRFFYENPLQVRIGDIGREKSVVEKVRTHYPIPERVEVFSCSCCPPNITRMFAQLGRFIFGLYENNLVVRQYISATTGGITVRTDYPTSGAVHIEGKDYTGNTLYLRKPYWAELPRITVDGKAVAKVEVVNGYMAVRVGKNFSVDLHFDVRPRFVYANPKIAADVGRVALTCGPVVYALESVDNGENLDALTVCVDGETACTYEPAFGMNRITVEGYRETADGMYTYRPPREQPVRLEFIPYYAFANRGPTDMTVWVRRR